MNSTENSLKSLTEKLSKILNDKGFSVGFAESCTGGLLSSELAKMPGVSRIFKGSVICYANEVKTQILGVDPKAIQSFGAVSEGVAKQMLTGALKVLSVDVAAAITGIAGPDGGSKEKPVGTVFIAVGGFGDAVVVHERFFDLTSRESVQEAAAKMAVIHLMNFLETKT